MLMLNDCLALRIKIVVVFCIISCTLLSGCSKDPMERVRSHHECIQCDLSGYDLSGLMLAGVNLSKANLSGADFSNASLNGVNFTDANISGANFNGASLKGVKFIGTNVSNASFKNAEIKRLIIGGKVDYLFEGVEDIWLEISEDIKSLSVKKSGEVRIRGKNSSVGKITIESVKSVDIRFDMNGSLGELYLSNIQEASDWFSHLGLKNITVLSIRDISYPIPIASSNLTIEKFISDGVSYKKCSGLFVLSGEITNSKEFGRCELLREFGRTNNELRVSKIEEKHGGVNKLYASVSKRLKSVENSIEKSQSLIFSTGKVNSRGGVYNKKLFSGLLDLNGEWRNLIGLSHRAIRLRSLFFRPAGDVASAIKRIDVSVAAKKWEKLLSGETEDSVNYQYQLHSDAINKSGILFCKVKKLPPIPKPNKLDNADEIVRLDKLHNDLPMIEKGAKDFEVCVQNGVAKYNAFINDDKRALIELTLAINEELNNIQIEKDSALAERQRKQDEYERTFYNAVSVLYDVDDIVNEEFLEITFLAQFSLGREDASSMTSRERSDWIRGIKGRVSDYLSLCLSGPYVRDERGFVIKPNKSRDDKNLKIISILGQTNSPRRADELFKENGVDVASTFTEEYTAHLSRCMYGVGEAAIF